MLEQSNPVLPLVFLILIRIAQAVQIACILLNTNSAIGVELAALIGIKDRQAIQAIDCFTQAVGKKCSIKCVHFDPTQDFP